MRVIHICYRNKKKADRGEMDSFETWLESSTDAPSARKTSTWVLELMKPETSLEAQVANSELSCFGHAGRRQGSLGKTSMLGK